MFLLLQICVALPAPYWFSVLGTLVDDPVNFDKVLAHPVVLESFGDVLKLARY